MVGKQESKQEINWQRMLSRSFEPWQWFIDGDSPGRDYAGENLGEVKMWVYREVVPCNWAVGFYDPKGDWHLDSVHGSKGAAAARVRWLNGG